MALDDSLFTKWFEDHRQFLWGLSYRVTGSVADADDVVQETFIRALEHTPTDLSAPRPWLVRVAVNVSRDLLRSRRRRSYIGPWLPDPVETPEGGALPSYEPAVDGQRTLESRYDLMESVSIAFLQALEVLTPTQRAVLLLRDVFDYSASEVSKALGMSDGTVRIVHHRARRAMAAYDGQRSVPTIANRERTSLALEQFLELLGKADVKGIEQMLAADVRAVTDGGGEFSASPYPIVGRTDVARFFVRLATSRGASMRIRLVDLNGFAAALFDFDAPIGRRAPRLVLAANVNTEGCITRLWVIANPRKLASVSSP
jgi:RNA polymerase sigma-70 factor (ECF subfamily)